MKKLILLLFLAGTLQAADLSVSVTTVTGLGSVGAGAKQVIFIFNTDTTVTLPGGAVYTGADQSLTIRAPKGDRMGAIAYFVTAGSMRVVRLN